MSIVWGQALNKAFPSQSPRLRPSGLGSCAFKQIAPVLGVQREQDGIGLSTWQAELGRAGESIAGKAFPYLGFDIVSSVYVEGDNIHGEVDWWLTAKERNAFGIEPGDIIGDVKLRNSYAYLQVWNKDDLMACDQGVGVQLNTYMGMTGVHRGMVCLFPFDTSAVRNDRANKIDPKDWAFKPENVKYNPSIRLLTVEFNQSLYDLCMQRKKEIEEAGLDVMREYEPEVGKFPCTWNAYPIPAYCEVFEHCLERGQGTIPVTQLPTSGMPIKELSLG